MREEMAMCKIKDVSKLYALADKCARAEEGKKLPGENTGAGESDSEDTAPARKGRRRNNKKKKNQEVVVVEQSGDEGATKKAQAGGYGKEVAGCTNCQAVAVVDKRDGTNKQYCKIHRTKGHDLQSCKQVERLVELQKAEYERRDKEKPKEVVEDPTQSALAREDAAARTSSGKQTDLPAAATRTKTTTKTKTWMMSRPVSRSFRKPQRSCA